MTVVQGVHIATSVAPHSHAGRVAPEVVIIHNHWIHYKDLLFRAMLARSLSFKVLFTAASSKFRLPARALAEAPYSYEISFPAEYERVNNLHAAIRTWRALTRLRPRILVISGWYDGAGWSAWAWGISHKTPMLLWAESNSCDRPRHFAREAVKRFFVRRFVKAYVYGQSNREYMLQLGMEDHQILTKRAVLDVRRFTRHPEVRRDPGCLTFLYVGRFSPEKNLESLLEAIHQLRGERLPKPLKLVLAGYGPLESKLRALVGKLDLQDSVVFTGAVEQEHLPSIYSAADVFVLPSLSEAWGLVANEAMCCELPVALSNRCGCAKDLAIPDTGWTFDPTDISDMVRVLRCIAVTPTERLAEMGKGARELSAQYSPENCAAQVVGSISQQLDNQERNSSQLQHEGPC
jgi:glycosyltransferase involved in cell wall biosynthesis